MSLVACICFLISLTANAVEKTAASISKELFYNHEQFIKLSDADQKTYLRELQTIFSEMSEKSDYFSQNIIDSDTRWARLLVLENAYAANPMTEELRPVTTSIVNMAKYMTQIEEIKKKNGDYKSDEIQKLYDAAIIEFSNAQKTFNSLKDRTSSHEPYKAAKDDLAESSFFIIDYTTKVKNPNTVVTQYLREQNPKRKSELLTVLASGKIDTEIKEDFSKKPFQLSALEVAPSETQKLPVLTRGSTTTRSSVPSVNEKPAATVSSQTERVPSAKPTKPRDEPAPLLSEVDRKLAALSDGYACMNSGFIIKTPPCVAPKNLSELYNLTDLKDPNAFSCPEGQQVCNPFLFGFKPKSCKLQTINKPEFRKECLNKKFKPGDLPYCVRNNSLATQQCSDLSKGPDSITNAVELIKMNPKAWDEYRNDFYKLCDTDYINFNNVAKFNRTRKVTEDYIRNDIKKTCEVAKKRVAILNERYNVETAPIKLKSEETSRKGSK